MRMQRLIWQNLIRNRKNLMFSSVGLIVGISTFVFFFALGEGVQTVVLEEIFQIRQVEVIPRSFDLGLTKASFNKLNDKAINNLRQIDGVASVYPKMKFAFTAKVFGGKELLGKELLAEAVADGLPAEIVQEDLATYGREHFRDWEAELTCIGEGVGPAVGCLHGQRCLSGLCTKLSCNPSVDQRYNPCTGDAYCAADTQQCEQPIPAIVNPALLAIYNSSLTTAAAGSDGVTLPKLSEEALVGLVFGTKLGDSRLGRSRFHEPFERKVQIVGFSKKAISLGFTIPIQYVKRFNSIFSGQDTRQEYHSVVLEAESNERISTITKEVKSLGYDLDDKHAQAERLGLVITIVTTIFTLISLLIVTVSAINIAHTFFMIIAERRREIGILRAIGANRWHIRAMILGEAALLGVIGGVVGVIVGRLGAMGIDALSAHYIPDFPFKPESFFVFETSIQIIAIVAAILFCILGAYLPARRAAGMEPARAFSTQ